MAQLLSFMKSEVTHNILSLVIDHTSLQFEKSLGIGASCEVFKARWHKREVAVKRIYRKTIDPAESKELSRELSILLRIRPHPNIVSLLGVSYKDGLPMLVTEYCRGGTLYDLLHKRKDIVLTWAARLNFALDIAHGVNYLHSEKPAIIHRDLKTPKYILVFRTFSEKLF